MKFNWNLENNNNDNNLEQDGHCFPVCKSDPGANSPKYNAGIKRGRIFRGYLL